MVFYQVTTNNTMAVKWKDFDTYDLECDLETLLSKPEEDEVESFIVTGCTERIPFLDFSSNVLPKKVISRNSSSESGSVKLRGRGRSLTNRALRLDKPCRRPGQRATLEKAGPIIKSSEPSTLGSKFLGSEYLYDEMFPSLDKSSTVISDMKCSTQAASGQGSTKKTKKEKHLSSMIAERAKNKERSEQFILESSNVLCSSINNKNLEKHTSSQENFKDISDESDVGDIGKKSSDEIKSPSSMSSDKNKSELSGTGECEGKPRSDLEQDSGISNGSDKVLETSVPSSTFGAINSVETTEESEETHGDEQCKQLEINTHQNSNPEDDLQDNNDQANSCNELSQQFECKDQSLASLNDKGEHGIESQDNLFQEWDNKEDKNSDHFSDQDNSYIATSENTSLSQSSLEGSQCRETTNAKTLEESLDMSASDMEMEPCNVLLENLPLALSDEELQDIVEPYGKMEFYSFSTKDNSSKTCTIRMPSSLSGELLVVSLDGLEIHGHRIKATMEDMM